MSVMLTAPIGPPAVPRAVPRVNSTSVSSAGTSRITTDTGGTQYPRYRACTSSGTRALSTTPATMSGRAPRASARR